MRDEPVEDPEARLAVPLELARDPRDDDEPRDDDPLPRARFDPVLRDDEFEVDLEPLLLA
ncbi:MAG: hypothetical protein JO168_23480 [Solirubrobacterales bacterium]|nr:hypothetical protein [Solirubrobacterales bacterium]MBV9714397.1 hypothetical protein [Solirubrobacterales bacterium]